MPVHGTNGLFMTSASFSGQSNILYVSNGVRFFGNISRYILSLVLRLYFMVNYDGTYSIMALMVF